MITFGTDGWRGIISEDYTFANVRLVAAAVAGYIRDRGEANQGIVVGYDARFLSREYAVDCAAVLASEGIKVWLTEEMMTSPALTWQVVDRQAAGGVMITASHNPPEYNGLKFKATYGGSASPAIVADIEVYVRRLEAAGLPVAKVALPATVPGYEPRASYLQHVQDMLEGKTLKKFAGKAVFDVMHGAASGYTTALAAEYGLNLQEIHSEYNPSFGGVNPEPIMKNLAALRNAMVEQRATIGLATDGDGDRIGAMDADGRFINSSEIMALLIRYFVEKRGWGGDVALTMTVSALVKKTAAKYGLRVHETPVGFKYIADLMLKEDILIGGEESGGIGLKNNIPERDGVLLGFLLIEVAAAYGKTLGQLLDEMATELGCFCYQREDLHIDLDKKARLMATLMGTPLTSWEGYPVVSVNQSDGCKLYLEDGWAMFRASGTEPIVRIYCEASSRKELEILIGKAVAYVQEA